MSNRAVGTAVIRCCRLLLCAWVLLSGFGFDGAVGLDGMLFPRESESRQIQELDGFWHFRADDSTDRRAGLDEQWFLKRLAATGPVIPMPISSSFNDITTDRKLQNFVGWVWYDRGFFVSMDWSNRRVVLRVESAHYNAIVWVNGKEVVRHSGGHLPFEAQINNFIKFSEENFVTIAVNNTLTPHTLPPGTVTLHRNSSDYPPNFYIQNVQFDFFNYAGLHRKVHLYTTPNAYIDDITVVTQFHETTGIVNYVIKTKGQIGDSAKSSMLQFHGRNDYSSDSLSDVSVEVLDRNGSSVAKGSGNMGQLMIKNVIPWWPYTMNHTHYGYQYTLKVKFGSDVYRQKFGVRTVSKTQTGLFINNKAFYCHGVAKHEDSDIRGKGLDFPLIARDFNMLKWLGANCFRTSHYPYAEEIMDEADQQGIVVIDECPGVGIDFDINFSNESLAHHLEVMREMVRRDKNRPAVIMWSVANEPRTQNRLSVPYFKSVIDLTRSLDPTRLVTYVIGTDQKGELVAQLTDILCINRYFAWYDDPGYLETIYYKMGNDLQSWYNEYKKPIIITEYGADTVAGLHTIPSSMFTEDYQADFLREYHHVFDIYRKKFLVGEMVWNYADFMTAPSVTRVVGNRKGVLTRQRQPKAAGHILRLRYWSIINETLPFPAMP